MNSSVGTIDRRNSGVRRSKRTSNEIPSVIGNPVRTENANELPDSVGDEKENENGNRNGNGNGNHLPNVDRMASITSGMDGIARKRTQVPGDGNEPKRRRTECAKTDVPAKEGVDNSGLGRAIVEAMKACEFESSARKESEANNRELLRLGRLDPLYRETGRVFIDASKTDVLSGMLGMENVSKMLWQLLVKPAVAGQLYRDTIGQLGPLHFAIVGPEGTGKRTAVRTACSIASVDAVFLRPSAYQLGDVAFALRRACSVRPSLICFEDFDVLHKDPNFDREFADVILGCREICGTFDSVWLAFTLVSEDIIEWPMFSRLIGRRVSRVSSLGPEDASRLLMSFITSSGINLGYPLTEEEATKLGVASEECTPSELKAFAGEVCMSALSRRELDVLAYASIPGGSGEDGKNQGRSDDGVCHRETNITISWHEDAVVLYETVADSLSAVQKSIIPRYERRK